MAKILILSGSVGHGHVRAAETLAAATKRWFGGHEARHVDMLTLVPGLFRKTYKDMYLKMVNRHPELWGYLYHCFDHDRAATAFEKMRRKLESACSYGLRKELKDFAPDHIICTHFMPQQVLARWRRKGRINCGLWACVTDFVAHRFWLEPGLDGYFTASEENAMRMRNRGLADENIYTSGIPVMPEFSDHENREQAAAELGLDPARQYLLLMGGGAGIGDMGGLAKKLLALAADFQLLVLCGNNRELLGSLEEMAKTCQGRLLPMGFTRKIPQLLRLAHLVITKPGGLTTMECLAMGKPMLIYSPIPGQEEFNADFLLENRAALKAPDASGLIWRIDKLLRERSLLADLAAHAAALGRPLAARDIIRTVLA